MDPTGVPAKTETRIPIAAQVTDNTAAHIVTLRKFLKIHIAETAGKFTRDPRDNAGLTAAWFDDRAADCAAAV